jgi:hypothetical protein
VRRRIAGALAGKEHLKPIQDLIAKYVFSAPDIAADHRLTERFLAQLIRSGNVELVSTFVHQLYMKPAWAHDRDTAGAVLDALDTLPSRLPHRGIVEALLECTPAGDHVPTLERALEGVLTSTHEEATNDGYLGEVLPRVLSTHGPLLSERSLLAIAWWGQRHKATGIRDRATSLMGSPPYLECLGDLELMVR